MCSSKMSLSDTTPPLCRRSTILDSPVTEQEFLEQLHELNNKINFAKELSFRETLACSDIQDIVDRLKLKVRMRCMEEEQVSCSAFVFV